MITDTSAIVLKTIPFSESSLIVTILSEKHGKMAVMARGARRNKNKFGGLLQPGAILEVSYYYKPTRDVQNLSDVTQKQATWRIHQQMEKMAIGLATLELCEQLSHEYEPNPEMSGFLSDFLTWLHDSGSNPRFLFPYIQIRLAHIAGIGITLQLPEVASGPESFQEGESAVPVVNEPESKFMCYLNVESGSITEKADNGLCFGLTKSQTEYLRYIAGGRKALLLNAEFPISDIKHLIHHLDAYFQYHLEGIRGRRSDAIFEQIL
jgi:DNA repair protein RecO (recombination protein O)